MTDYLIGGYGPDMGGTASGITWGRSYPDGRFEVGETVAVLPSPSFLVPEGDRVYAVLEGSGELAKLTREGDGWSPAWRVPAGGSAPCHLAVDAGAVIVACYADGAVAVHRPASDPQVLPGSGDGPLPAQDGPHAHHVRVVGEQLLTLDLGADRVHRHRWRGDVLERVESLPLPPGTGPRDLLELPDGRVAVLGEWSCEVVLLERRGETFEIVQIVALPGAEPGEDQAAALGLSADGRFLVAGIRGADRIAVLALDPDAVRPVGWAPSGGATPRHLVVDGEFVHVANQGSGTITTLRLGPDGTLAAHGAPVPAPSPTCLAAVGATSNL